MYLNNIIRFVNHLVKIDTKTVCTLKTDLTHETAELPSYRNQSTDLQSKSIDWFLYNGSSGF